MKGFYWCNNGCGKTVVFKGHTNPKGRFICFKCSKGYENKKECVGKEHEL